MATASIGLRGRVKVKSSLDDLNKIKGGSYIEGDDINVFDLTWDVSLSNSIFTSNSIIANNALVFQYAKEQPFKGIEIYQSSNVGRYFRIRLDRSLDESIPTNPTQDTVKYIKEIKISF